MTVRLEHADMLEAIPRLVAEGVVCDAVVTDPPYHLVQISERSKYPVKYGKDGAMQRLLSGFMGQTWDGGDIAFRPETWATVATILRPGAFLVAFGGTRTYHRLACAIEDGGFVIQDCLMWLFATGFPKRRDMLKPAYEPIVLAYKPGGKRTMQIDECRIHTEGSAGRQRHGGGTGGTGGDFSVSTAEDKHDLPDGRWPANVCHDGSDEVLAAFPDSAGQLFKVGPEHGDRPTVNCYGDYGPRPDCPPRGDTGSAARFFFSAKAGAQDRWGSRHPTVKPVELMKWLIPLVTPKVVLSCEWCDNSVQAKADQMPPLRRDDKSLGTCPKCGGYLTSRPGIFLDPFAGSGTAGVAALATGRDCILIEREDAYAADIRERLAHYEGEGRHSLASKARRTEDKPLGGLFAPPYDEAADARDSYTEAVRVIGERVKAGAPVPDFFLPTDNKL